MTSSPFVRFKMMPTAQIGNTPQLIFGNDAHVCVLDGLMLTNLTDNAILVSLHITREGTAGAETDFTLMNQVSLSSQASIDVLKDASLTLEPGDLLYATSDYSYNLFNVFISYRELMELSQ